MAMENPELTDEVIAAMQTRQGDLYDEAIKRLQFQQAMKAPGLSTIYTLLQQRTAGEVIQSLFLGILPATLLPSGELKSIGLYDEYKTAIEKYNNGDKNAVDDFFEEHPEYRARMAANLWDDPEERTRQYLINAVYEGYFALPDLSKREVVKTFGPDFEKYLLNSETKDLENIDVKTLANWAYSLNEDLPYVVDNEKIEIAYPTDHINTIYGEWTDLKNKKYPDIGTLEYNFWNLNEEGQQYLMETSNLSEYWIDKNEFMSKNHEIIPFMISKKNPLYGVDNKTQEQVIDYRAERNRKFPGIIETQIAYMELGDDSDTQTNEQSKFLSEHPELNEYWQWNTSQLYEHNDIIPYVISDQSSLSQLSPEEQKHVLEYRKERNDKYPELSLWERQYNSLQSEEEKDLYLARNPELMEAWYWKDKYILEHPNDVYLITTDKSSYADLSPDEARKLAEYRVYRYENYKDTLPKFEVYSQINPTDWETKRRYWETNPDMQAYLDYKRKFTLENPELIEKINTEKQIDKMFNNQYNNPSGVYIADDDMNSAIANQMLNYYV
jgi:hypothetical protein